MNILFIPSWHASPTNLNSGVFIKEQCLALAEYYPKSNIGISTWGQNDERLLLWSGQPFRSLGKLFLHLKPKASKKKFKDNLVEYFTPRYTWSSKILRGNMDQIIKSNQLNLEEFQHSFGKVDVIHAHVGFPGGYIARRLSETNNIPYIITEQMSPFPHKYYKKLDGSLSKGLSLAYKDSSRNIAISNALACQMKKFEIHGIVKIPNLINENFFTYPLKKKDTKKFIFFTLGRMVPQKGIDILLKAFSKLNTEAVLKIGGDGDYASEYKKLATKLQIEDKIEWLGELNRTQALQEFQNCNAFVLPSRHESMGVVFGEAMACGKPVIGTICGGPEEFIDESNGYLIEAENELMLIKAMEKMIKYHDQFDAENIRQQCWEKFSTKVICRQIMSVYQEVIAKNKMN